MNKPAAPANGLSRGVLILDAPLVEGKSQARSNLAIPSAYPWELLSWPQVSKGAMLQVDACSHRAALMVQFACADSGGAACWECWQCPPSARSAAGRGNCMCTKGQVRPLPIHFHESCHAHLTCTWHQSAAGKPSKTPAPDLGWIVSDQAWMRCVAKMCALLLQVHCASEHAADRRHSEGRLAVFSTCAS